MSTFEVMEVVEAFTALILAYKECISLYQNWRFQAPVKSSKALYNSLMLGASRVQEEYDQHYGRLGNRFASGDDIAKAEIMHIAIKMQGLLITLLQSAITPKGITLDIAVLQNISESSRVDSIKSLASLFQRLTTTDIPTSEPSPSSTMFCIGAKIMQQDTNLRSRSITEHDGSCKCRYCGSIVDLRNHSFKVGWLFNPEWTVTADFLAKSHVPGGGTPRDGWAYGAVDKDIWASYCCVFCEKGARYLNVEGLVKHLRKHVWMGQFRGDTRIQRQSWWESKETK